MSGSPRLLLLTSQALSGSSDYAQLYQLAKDGQSMVFCDLPDIQTVIQSETLKELLGIQYAMAESTDLTGIQLYSGFLLGGDVIYEMDDSEEQEKWQDFTLSAPWYVVLSGVKTYMIGMVDESMLSFIDNEYLPPLIWRNSLEEAKIFVVNGDYMSDAAGIGILEAMMAELLEYDVYPVVNAQNVTVANYFGLAEENGETMQEIYSRNQREVFRDIMWPGLMSVATQGQWRMTCFFMPQYDYYDDEFPRIDDYLYYLKQLKEQDSETGISLETRSDITLQEKVDADQQFFQSTGCDYPFSAAYVTASEREAFSTLSLPEIRTLSSPYEADIPLLSYDSDNVTYQSTTTDGFTHTYLEDFRTHALETALAYENVLIDMKRISWPQDENDRWEKLSDDFARNLCTYWKPFEMFERTTLSESDARVRRFLALDYEDERTDDTIHLTISNFSEEAYFILRTHAEEIDEVEGGTFTEIEDGAYLIQAEREELSIRLKPDEDYTLQVTP
jgi:hypothetical protein